VIFTAFTGLSAVYISAVQGTSRIVFALARHRLLPKSLARLVGEKRVPRAAVASVLIAVVVLDLSSLYLLKNGLESFTWWANALVFFAVLTFLAVNIANGCHFGFFRNFGVSIIGVLLNGYLLYAAFFSALWAGDWRTGKSVVMGCLGLLALQMAG